MKAVLLSDPATAEFINREFVASWECVRPAPQVTIDFGNGKVLKRTLAGNTVFYICLPDGRVVDALSGVYTPADFRSEAAKALAIVRTLEHPTADAEFNSALAEWHKRSFTDAIQSEKHRITFSKAMVESPLLQALGLLPQEGRPIPITPQPSTTSAVSPTPYTLHPTPTLDLASAYAAITSRLEDISHQAASAVQTRKKILSNGLPGDLSPEELAKMAVELDSRNNVRVVRPAVHALLAMSESPRGPSDLRDTICKEILRIPIDDPMLGLGIKLPGTP